MVEAMVRAMIVTNFDANSGGDHRRRGKDSIAATLVIEKQRWAASRQGNQRKPRCSRADSVGA